MVDAKKASANTDFGFGSSSVAKAKAKAKDEHWWEEMSGFCRKCEDDYKVNNDFLL